MSILRIVVALFVIVPEIYSDAITFEPSLTESPTICHSNLSTISKTFSLDEDQGIVTYTEIHQKRVLCRNPLARYGICLEYRVLPVVEFADTSL